MFETSLCTIGGVFRLTGDGVRPFGLPSVRISAIHARREERGCAVLQPIADH